MAYTNGIELFWLMLLKEEMCIMKSVVFAFATAVAMLNTACAKSPESIQPQYVSPIQYQELDCKQLSKEASRNEVALSQASKQQRDARTNDTVGVILLGLPVSSLSGGNVSDYVARLKGERDALLSVMNKRRCGQTIKSATEVIQKAVGATQD